MCPMAGMPASCSRRLPERCCAETCLRGLETALHSPKVTSSNLQSLRKICSTTPVLVRLQGQPFASLPTSNRRFWLPCTARHFPVTGQLPLGPWVTTTTFACARHRAKLSFSPRCLLMAHLYGPAVRCKPEVMIWRLLVLRFCIRPLSGAFALLAIMDIRAHLFSFASKP